MNRFAVRALGVTLVLAAVFRVESATIEFEPFDRRPPAVSALGAESELEAFAVVPAAAVAVAATASPAAGSGSTLRIAHGADEPRAVTLAGKLVGLVVVPDGSAAYAAVLMTNRKGAVRSNELVRIDLASTRASSVAALPTTATGLAISADGATLFAASKDEIRSFLLPSIASGRLYRVLGENVGCFPLEGTSYVLVAQRTRVALIDLSGSQGRDGLELKEPSPSPAPLTGLLTSVGDDGPIALAEGGLAWRVRVPDFPAPPVPKPPAPAAAAAAEPALQETPPPPPVEQVAPPAPSTPPVAPPPAESVAREIPGEPGTVSGSLSGPAAAEVAAVVFLGPDNVLREAARAAPDTTGRFVVSALLPGAYRIVAAGKGGRVLVCRPPFISVRVGPNSAVEAPVLEVLRAQ